MNADYAVKGMNQNMEMRLERQHPSFAYLHPESSAALPLRLS